MRHLFSCFATAASVTLVAHAWNPVAKAHPGHHRLDLSGLQIVTVDAGDLKAGMPLLMDHGFELAGIDVDAGTMDFIVVPSAIPGSALAMFSRILAVRDIDPLAAPDSGYHTRQEVQAALEALAAEYPEIITLHVLGQSHRGTDILAAKISDNAAVDEPDEPAALFNGMHHAREVMSTEVIMDMAHYLVERYEDDTQVRAWVEANEIWLVPMVNPDGSDIVWSSNNMWRKNARGNYGVDLNRNYPEGWNSCRGSSGFAWSQTYRGPSPASEPETRALMGLVERTRPVIDFSYHSYSELVLYPYGCSPRRTVNRDVVEGFGQQIAAALLQDDGSGTYTAGTPWELLYNADGGDIDWMYAQYQVMPYVIELSASPQGFQPDYGMWRDATVRRNRAGWQLALDRLAGPGIRGRIMPDGTQATVSIRDQGSARRAPYTYTTDADGWFHAVLAPGDYILTIAADDAITEEIAVSVGAGRSDLAPIALTPQP